MTEHGYIIPRTVTVIDHFLVVRKKIFVVDKPMEPPEQQKMYCTETVVTCPPRSLVGLGSELLAKEFNTHMLMELHTTSSGGLLSALSGAVVWRTPGDLCRLMALVGQASFADGRLVSDVLTELIVPLGEPLEQLLQAKGDVEALDEDILEEVRLYITRLVEAAEENRLPLSLLRPLLSFLGSPPGASSESRPRHPPMDVWQTRTHLSGLQADTSLCGHARKRHHTSEFTGARESAPSCSGRGPRRRHRSAPLDPCSELLGCDDLYPLPASADHPLDQQLADRTVRFCIRPEAGDWEGSAFSECWRQELATQHRCRIVGKVTFLDLCRWQLRKETRKRCNKQDNRRLRWKRCQEAKRIQRQRRRTASDDSDQENRLRPPYENHDGSLVSMLFGPQKLAPLNPGKETPEKPPHPYPEPPLLKRLFGMADEPIRLGSNMLVIPPKLESSGQKPAPEHTFGPRRRFPVNIRELLLTSPQSDQRRFLKVMNAQAQRHIAVNEKRRSSPATSRAVAPPSAQCPNGMLQQPVQRLSNGGVTGQETESPGERGETDQETELAEEAVELAEEAVEQLTLEYFRYHLLDRNFSAIEQGRKPRKNVDRLLPPRSPLAGPAPPESTPQPASTQAKRPGLRPGLWLRLMGMLPGAVVPPPPRDLPSRPMVPRIQTTPQHPVTQPHNNGIPPLPAQGNLESPRVQGVRPSPRTPCQRDQHAPPQSRQRVRPSPAHSRQRVRPSPRHSLQRMRPSPALSLRRARPPPTQRLHPAPRNRSVASPSLWSRIKSRLGLSRQDAVLEYVEVGQEAAEERVRAIVEYQKRLPPSMRDQLLRDSFREMNNR